MLKIMPCVLLSLALAGPAAAQVITSGFYAATGTDIDGTAYDEPVVAIAIDGASCSITYGTGADAFEAICLIRGDTLSAAYAAVDAATLVVYTIRDDGTLEGVWTMQGETGTGTEVLTPYR